MFIILNGKFYSEDEPVVKTNNRAFCYGDALFETMRWEHNQILLFRDHINRLFKGMKFLKMQIAAKFSEDFIQKQIAELVRKNKISGSARIRLQAFRNEGGYYIPTDNSTGVVITVEKLNEENFNLNKKGLTVNIFSKLQKSKHQLSNFKTSNCLIYSLAGIFAKENKFDDCFILNTDENITDSISSNVFVVNNETVITPPLSDGCVDGVMRKNILRICRKQKINTEEKSVNPRDLLDSDEIFLTNAIQGIRWVKRFKKINYKNDFSRFLNREINKEFA